ncbi:LytTR family DNA-binding domain-containing protein [Loigolactobacillus iwatensis]|uniref:LytTR family DNA-binding domain-containing protein n=1 Tax=Loigolactobacillus iwatensis TaxID=1267156 RepID=UPI000F7F2A55|nr:LytTR family DNA-binding domain-containing protein [Loigolactobacillus iwatensis]
MKTNFFVSPDTRDEHTDFFLKKLTPEIQQIASQLVGTGDQLWGYREDDIVPLKFNQIELIYAQNNRVFVEIASETLLLKQRLYQLELILPSDFIRVSKSEIVNYHHIDHLELSNNGLINILLTNQSRALVSRRYMTALKRRIGL